MTEDYRIIPPSINDDRSQYFLELVARLSEIDIDTILDVYNFDTVDVSALPHLAEQLDVTGYRGWLLADTEDKQRNLLKKAIELHRYRGTRYAIRLALESLGYYNVVITENPEVLADAIYYDGVYSYNGERAYTGSSATEILYGGFIVNLQTPGALSPEQEALVIACINEWKNARSHLILPLLTSALLIYNGEASYDGEYNFAGFRTELALQNAGGYALDGFGLGPGQVNQLDDWVQNFQVSSNGSRFTQVVVQFTISVRGAYSGHTVTQGSLTVNSANSLTWTVGELTSTADITLYVRGNTLGSVTITGVASSEAVGESNTDSNTADGSFTVV